MATAKVHRNESVEWGSPEWCVEGAKRLMGGIDLDPASSHFYNQYVLAANFYTKFYSGLERPWYGRVFLNPPGRLVKQFWSKLVEEWQAGRVGQAVWVGFNLDQLRQLQAFDVWPLSYPTFFPAKRMRFRKEDGTVPTNATAANYVTYLWPRPLRGESFEEAFGGYGRINWPSSVVARGRQEPRQLRKCAA